LEALSLSLVRMEEEIERRLERALREIDSIVPADGVCGDRMRAASREIIKIFSESES